MITFIAGGAKSGKSLFAEKQAYAKYKDDVLYIATSVETDDEQRSRIKRHKQQREKYNWQTLEKPCDIGNIKFSQKAILLECLVNLVANQIYVGNTSYDDVCNKVINDIVKISKNAHVYLIVNEIDLGYDCYLDQTNEFLEKYYQIAASIAKLSDEKYEIISGCVKEWKNV